MSNPIQQIVPIDFQWPTIDPFLFCVHHVDHFPRGNADFGPAASLVGRDLGQDFAGIDGWRMYHGSQVPGFPQHPHRGFETVTFVRQGLVDHSDSMGARARYGRGDVQWLTAGSGVVHAEMFPLLDLEADNTMELFQIWINLPAANKMAPPFFKMLWDTTIPRATHVDTQGRSTVVTVVAGSLGGETAPSPPPDSWASQSESDVAIWHIRMDPGAEWTLPEAEFADAGRMLYLFNGESVRIGDQLLPGSSACVLAADQPQLLVGPDGGPIELLILQGRPIGEPVAQYGPFVMNTNAEIRQAFDDYRATSFGGWPWATDGPVHGGDPQRFAQRTDGQRESSDAATNGHSTRTS